ncbi:MAG: hypothetical protein AAFU59_07790 [Pseudomonadota bacterium]
MTERLTERLTALGDYLSNGVLRVLGAVLRLLPYERRLEVGGWIGRRVTLNLPPARNRVLTNVERVFPDLGFGARMGILRGVGDNFGRVMIEQMMMDDFIDRRDKISVTGPGYAPFMEAVQEGNGAIFASAHFGQWEAGRIFVRDLGIEIAAVYRSHNNPYFDADFKASLEAVSPAAFAKGKEGMRGLIRHVRKGGVAAVLVDQKQTGSPKIPFLGHPAETTTSVAKLAVATGTLLIPTISRRLEDGVSFEVVLGEPVPHGPEEEMMREVNDQLSAWITETPEQWFWYHRRWRF